MLLDVVPLFASTHNRVLAAAQGCNMAICDALIVAAAPEADCSILWSEVMQDGLFVEDRLLVRNPFREGSDR